jgi:predicted transcriptional regulator
VLEAVGIDGMEERVYRELVATFDADPGVLAQRLDASPAVVRSSLESLQSKGLVRRVAGDSSAYLPTPPDVGLGPLLLRGQEALEGARQDVSQLTETYHRGVRRRDHGRLVEVITGGDALRRQLHDLQLGARTEVVALCKAGHVTMPSADNTEEFAALAKGVRYRVIYEQALLDEPGMLANVTEGLRAGEAARATSTVPVRLMIADQRLGLCPLVPVAEGFGEPTAALVRDSNLLTALQALFESYWERSSPLHVDGPGQTVAALPAEDRALLSLLVSGVTDKAIANNLGISQRTVQRRIAELLSRAGAVTRPQLAWQAARLGWLD